MNLSTKYFGAPLWLWGGLGLTLIIAAKPAVSAVSKAYDLSKLHPDFKRRVQQWLDAVSNAGYVVKITETLRDASRQAQLEAQGSSTVKTSYHQSGLAIDYIVTDTPTGKVAPYKGTAAELKALSDVAQIAKRFGMRWGGDWTSFKDGYHLELDTPIRITEAFARYQRQGQNWSLV